MPITFEFKESIFLIHFSGVVSSTDLMETHGAVDEAEDRYSVTPHRITDLSAVTEVQVGFDDILSLASQRRVKRFSNFFKSAIVAGNEIQTGYARMFQTLNTNPQITIRIFPDMQAALAWISAPTD